MSRSLPTCSATETPHGLTATRTGLVKSAICATGMVVLGLVFGVSQAAPASQPTKARTAAAAKATGPQTSSVSAVRRPSALAKPTAHKPVPRPAPARKSVAAKAAVAGAAVASVVAARAAPPRMSMGQLAGLHHTPDPLDLKSSVALVLDRNTNEVLFSKNAQAVLPIASITKLMTSMVVVEHNLDMDEVLAITQDDVDTEKGSGSRLAVGTKLTRREMLHLALMSSENRAAHALGRHYPGGLPAFVAEMNRRAQELGMHDTRFVEPTGLSSKNQSSAHDLALLVKASNAHDTLRQFSTSQQAQVSVGSRQLQFRNTNGLVRSGAWDIALQKTGYISEAGRCVVMLASMAGRELVMVLMDSAGNQSRIGDAERLRKWVLDKQTKSGSSATEPPTVPTGTVSESGTSALPGTGKSSQPSPAVG